MSIRQNLAVLTALFPLSVKLVAVSKTQPPEAIQEAYDNGQRRFGENKVQELLSKQPLLPDDIEWHFIGHLQTNKVKLIVPIVKLIHSIDSLRLLSAVNIEASKIGRVVDCLLEMHIATEDTKFGMDLDEARSLLGSPEYWFMRHIRITGLMGMATFTNDDSIVRKEFRKLHSCFQVLKEEFFRDNNSFAEISMGMSEDFRIAIEEGSTMVRIGTAIFGVRN
jgi:PLP dependent protein